MADGRTEQRAQLPSTAMKPRHHGRNDVAFELCMQLGVDRLADGHHP
jgi:hypothetical protein